MNDVTMTVGDLKRAVQEFTNARGWNPDARSLAISISIEAAELLEHFQWRRYARKDDRGEIANELADVMIYCLQFAMAQNIDVAEAIVAKLVASGIKYPVDLFADGQDGTRNYYAAKEDARKSALTMDS